MLGEPAQPDVAAPSLADLWPVAEDESEETEPARH